MKITIVHGQSHRETTYHMAKLLVDRLGQNNDITEYFLAKDFDKFCLGCYQCITKSEEACPHYQQLKPIKSSLKQSDLLIFTTPVYCLHASASMKTLLDHCFSYFMVHKPQQEMFSKKAIILSASAGSRSTKAIHDIKDSLSYWGISHIYSYSIKSQAMHYSQVKEQTKSKLNKDLGKLAVRITASQAKTSIKTKGLFYMMRLMQLNNWSIAEDKLYWQQQGWLGKKRPWK